MSDPRPTTLIIFGATGDLVAKKIVPALFHLFQKGKLPDPFNVVGVSRRPISSEDFRARVSDIVSGHVHEDTDQVPIDRFLDLFSFQKVQFEEEHDYRALAAVLDPLDQKAHTPNRLIYLAVPPDLYPTIFSHLASSGLATRDQADGAWTRVIVEKPFGVDAQTAETIETRLAHLFDERQIYRIDHYLAKDMLQNIINFRFSNKLFEDNWNAKDIESIHIRLWEDIGVENRGSFYDPIGALRDVGQNHLLQMLALVTMDRPASFTPDDVRLKRTEILKRLHVPSEAEVVASTFRAQYDGYRQIAGVRPDSQTETYCSLRAYLDAPRWRGVPITMEAGKRLHERRKEMIVTFKAPYRNSVIFTLEPTEGITIRFWSKKPGLEAGMEQRAFDFVLRESGVRTQYVAEYEKLLLDCIAGDQTLFVSTDEVRAMWRFIDPILAVWAKNAVPLETYAPETDEAVKNAAEHLRSTSSSHAMNKELAIIGLGKMGANMARRMVEQGWRVLGWNRTTSVAEGLSGDGVTPVATFKDAVDGLLTPRIIWLMLPAGDPVDEALFGPEGIVQLLSPGDIVIDGGNSYFKDALRRAEKLREKGICFMDCGTSGGPGGARNGACLMIGGDRKTFEEIEPLFKDFARPESYQFFDGHGAGHFVKMVHNGIEYGMMQALAEGFEILKASDYHLDLDRVADIYNHGSVIESRLVGWMQSAFKKRGQDLEGVSSTVAHTGEGAWTVKTAKEMGIEVKIIEGSFQFRIDSENKPSYTGKAVSALREQFGGHSVEDKGKT